MSSIEARDIWKSLRGRQVLAGAGICVQEGEAVGLFGRSGSGKSTLFNILLGVLAQDSGSIRLDGRPLDDLPTDARARLGLGYVCQQPFIPPQLSVNAAMTMAAEGAGVHGRSGAVADVMARLAISHLARRAIGKLSGGERRRVEIGYMLVTKPRYLLLDEPFAGLDPLAIDALVGTLRDIADTGVGLLIAEHNHVDAGRLLDRSYVLDNGGLVARGGGAAQPRTRERALGETRWARQW